MAATYWLYSYGHNRTLKINSNDINKNINNLNNLAQTLIQVLQSSPAKQMLSTTSLYEPEMYITCDIIKMG